MARPKKFERDELVDRAAEVFWARGYEATSIPDLTARMGVLSGSLYNSFNDKHSLFVACLESYAERASAAASAVLAAPGSKRAAIARLFDALADRLAADPERRGCLLTNTAVERAGRDPAAMQVVAETQAALAQSLADALAAGERAGEFRPRSDAERRTLALALVAALEGLRVMAKTAIDPVELRAIARANLAMIG